MADIRINSLPTTASASSSDDFLALDGATNGTRKLNAFSPTFGGNATVGGTLGVSGTGVSQVNGTMIVGAQAAIGASLDVQTASGTASTFRLFQSGVSNWVWSVPASTDALVLSQYGTTEAMRFNSSRNATLSGNLTVNGGTATFQDPTNSYRVTLTTAAAKSVLATSFGGSSLALRTNGSATDALLIDSSLNTTLSGNLTVSGYSDIGGAVRATGATVPATGAGVEVQYFSAIGKMLSYDRGASAWKPLQIDGSYVALGYNNGNVLIGTTTDGGQKLQVNGTALLGSNNASFGAYFDYDVGVPGSATLWLKQTTKSASTYTLSGGGTYTALNAPSGGTLYLRIANGDGLTITATGATFAGSELNLNPNSGNAFIYSRVTGGGIGGIVIADSQASGRTYGIESGRTAGLFAIRDYTAAANRLTIDSAGAATFAGTAIFGKAGGNTTFSANGTTAESGIYTQANTGFVFFADNASATKGIKVDVNNGGLTVLSGGLTTATAGGSAGTWKLGVYSATAPSATGYVTIDIGGTTYKLLAST